MQLAGDKNKTQHFKIESRECVFVINKRTLSIEEKKSRCVIFCGKGI